MRASLVLGAVTLLAVGCSPDGPERPADPEPGIARALAAERAADLSNLRYELALDVPPAASDPVGGRVRIRFARTPSDRPLVLDFAPGEPALDWVRVDGRDVTYRATNGHIVIPAGELPDVDAEIDIAFRAGDGSLNRNPEFLYSLFVPARAHLAFPCFDQPDLKARFALELSVPSGWEAVANGGEISRQTAGDRIRIQFAETEPISTYLFAFAAGLFQIERADRGGRRFHMLHRETDAGKVARNRDAVFDLHASALAWLEDYTGIPYRFGKFDFVLVPSFQFSGMEHPGAIYYNSASLLLEESATESQMLGRASVIAHETAHMWFGDLVTMRWFDDVWMKEVFANFMAAKIVNPAFPAVNHDLRFLLAHYPAAYAVDRTEGTHPIRQELDNLNEAGSLYGAIIYQKAPIVMRQLERLLGADAMREGLREYLRRFEFGNATWLDLVPILDSHSDRDIAVWSRAWVEEAGRPDIRTERTGEGGTTVALIQSDPQADRGLRWTQQLEVAFEGAFGAKSAVVDLDAGRVLVPLLPPRVDFILPTGGGLGYGAFELDQASRNHLLSHVEDLRHPVTRGAVWIALWDELLEGRVPPTRFVEAALRALPRESTEQNVQLVARYLEDAFWRFLPPDSRETLAGRVERTLRDGLARAASSSLKATYFNAFRSLVTTEPGVAFLAEVWRRRESIPGLTLGEPDDAAMALELAVRGVTDASSILDEQLRRFQNPDRRARFAFVMPALSADTAVRDGFFDSLSQVSNRRREPWVGEGLSYLNHPLRAPDSERYIRPALTMLEDIQRTGDIFFPRNWVGAVLGGHRSPGAAATVRGFLDERPDYPLRLRRIILQAADELFRAAALR